MLDELTHTLISAIQQNGAKSVFLGAIVEQLAGVLIPSPIIPMSAGFLLISQDLLAGEALLAIAQKVALPYTLGAVLGTLFFYFLAWRGGRAVIDRFGRFFGLSLTNIDRFSTRFTRGKKDELLLFFLLILPITSISLVSSACGLISLPLTNFIPLMVGGIFIRALFLAWLGWQTGETFTLLAAGIDRIESIFSFTLVFGIFLLLAFGYHKRSQFFKEKK